jgi:diadenosine tetraphosphate (Ap4A) HIT family hydrolase
MTSQGELMNNCPFCEPFLKRSEVVIEHDHCLFLQREENVLIGSGLVIPKMHRETVFDLTQEEWTATYEMVNQVKTLLDQEFQPDGYNLGWNCGIVGGQEVFHAHLHIIPRFKDEPYAGRGIRYWLKQESNKR